MFFGFAAPARAAILCRAANFRKDCIVRKVRSVSRKVERLPAKRPETQARFGSEYFHKFYLSPATRVVTPREMRARALTIAAALVQADIRVRSILDAGCGIGLLKSPFAEVLPRARYTGLDASEYLSRRYGWILGSIADYVPRRPSDLVICYDVLQYLDDRDASRAIANFARMTRAGLYVSALTREDWRENCDQQRTDSAVHLRPGDWYRRRLRRNFRYLGFGLWVRKNVTPVLWDLERPRP
jgi:SAM-dependent methyltransferase